MESAQQFTLAEVEQIALAIYDQRRPLRLDLVIRTSQRKRDGESPDQQRQQAGIVCSQGGHEIVFTHDSGKSESGKTMDRESIRAFRERYRRGLTDGIVVGYLDRLGRAPIEESMTFVRELTGEGGALVAADWNPDPIDLADPNAEDMLVFRLQMNRSQWNKAKARYRQSQENAIAKGKWIGKAPIGYAKVTSGEKKGCLTPAKATADKITRAYRLAGSDGLHAAQSYLEGEYPGRFSTVDHVRRVLRSRAYRGEVHYKGFEPNLKAHDWIVTEAEWRAAQTEPGERRANGDYVLSKKLTCGRCGEGMVGGLKTTPAMRRVPGDHKRFEVDPTKPKRSYRRMVCTCKGGNSISAEVIEGYVLAVLKHALGNRAFRDSFAPEGLAEAEAAMIAAQDEVKALLTKVRPSDPNFTLWKAELEQDVREATQAWQRIAERAGHAERLPHADQLDDPVHYERGLAAVLTVGEFRVAPGRGSVEDRVDFVLFDDQMAGVFPA